MNRILFFCILIIGLVSVFDTYLSVIYSPHLRQLEQNPLGQYLLDTGGLTLFVEVKSVCTLIVVSLSFWLMKTKYKLAIVGVLIFQILLFLYLNFYTYDGFIFDTNHSPLLDVLDYYFNPDDFLIDPFPDKYAILETTEEIIPEFFKLSY
jgi:hypothetical protein